MGRQAAGALLPDALLLLHGLLLAVSVRGGEAEAPRARLAAPANWRGRRGCTATGTLAQDGGARRGPRIGTGHRHRPPWRSPEGPLRALREGPGLARSSWSQWVARPRCRESRSRGRHGPALPFLAGEVGRLRNLEQGGNLAGRGHTFLCQLGTGAVSVDGDSIHPHGNFFLPRCPSPWGELVTRQAQVKRSQSGHN